MKSKGWCIGWNFWRRNGFQEAIPPLAVTFLVATVVLARWTAQVRARTRHMAPVGIAAMLPCAGAAAVDAGPFALAVAFRFMAFIAGFAATSTWTARSVLAWLDAR